jgi:large subunit ribosomal protein L15
MPTRTQKKNKRQRGSSTHGFGARKKHRGSGNKGGVGMAGTGKRADQKKPTILKLYGNSYFGKHGFALPTELRKTQRGINLGELQLKLENWLELGLIKKEKDTYIIDAKKLGYNKILSQGNVVHKLKIYAEAFSEKALEKIKEAGGEAILPVKKQKENVPA